MTVSLSPGQAHAAPEGRKRLRRLGGQRATRPVMMDRASEGTETRPLARTLGGKPVGPPRMTRLAPWADDRERDKRRNEVERLFRRLKVLRRLFSRFEKLDVIFLGFIVFDLIFDALRSCERAPKRLNGTNPSKPIKKTEVIMRISTLMVTIILTIGLTIFTISVIPLSVPKLSVFERVDESPDFERVDEVPDFFAPEVSSLSLTEPVFARRIMDYCKNYNSGTDCYVSKINHWKFDITIDIIETTPNIENFKKLKDHFDALEKIESILALRRQDRRVRSRR